MPHLNHLLIAELYIGNFQIKYRTGSTRLFSCHKSTVEHILYLKKDGGAEDRNMVKRDERFLWVES